MTNLDQYKSEVEEWIAKKLPKASIIRRLTEKGLDKVEANNLFFQCIEVYNLKRAKKNRPKWIIASLAYLLAYIFLIPVTTSFNSPYLSGILLGLLFGILLIQSIFSYRGVEDFYTSFNDPKKTIHRVFVSISIIISPIIFCSINSIKTANEFKNYGIKTEATVIDGYEKTTTGRRGRKSTSYQVTYTYFSKDKQKHVASSSITQQEYSLIYLEQKIYILYSSRHNEINKIIKFNVN